MLSFLTNQELVSYYDDTKFHGEIPDADVPFMKQRRFDYQREYRITVQTRIETDEAIRISVGSIRHISLKTSSYKLNSLLRIDTI